MTGREGVRIGNVEGMLGTEAEGIFHGIELHPASGGPTRVIPADAVLGLTTAEVRVADRRRRGRGAGEVHPDPG